MKETLRRIITHRDFDTWRDAARQLLAMNIRPEDVVFADADDDLLPGLSDALEEASQNTITVPPRFMQIAKLVAYHRSPQRWSLLYRVLWRLTHGQRQLLEIATDDDVMQLHAMQKAVSRDRHKTHAFVRFRKVVRPDGIEEYIAWHRPDHYILKLAAPFFRERFGGMNWSILTPDESVRWDGQTLTFGSGVSRSAAPKDDELEALWLTYFGSIFNPARIKLKAMRAEMPTRHWATLPETKIIPDLLAEAPARLEAMMARAKADAKSARDYLPSKLELPVLAEAVQSCRGCDIGCNGTQAVFGEGPAKAQCVFVGEQPGDNEEREGRPFIGPAGQLLDEMLEEAKIDRSLVYVTNAVKHFKFEPRGKRRIHAKPSVREVKACRPWLEAELRIIKPKMVVALGATAAQSMFGSGFRVTKQRGEIFSTDIAARSTATIHPSALLRMPDADARAAAREHFLEDLKMIGEAMKTL